MINQSSASQIFLMIVRSCAAVWWFGRTVGGSGHTERPPVNCGRSLVQLSKYIRYFSAVSSGSVGPGGTTAALPARQPAQS